MLLNSQRFTLQVIQKLSVPSMSSRYQETTSTDSKMADRQRTMPVTNCLIR